MRLAPDPKQPIFRFQFCPRVGMGPGNRSANFQQCRTAVIIPRYRTPRLLPHGVAKILLRPPPRVCHSTQGIRWRPRKAAFCRTLGLIPLFHNAAIVQPVLRNRVFPQHSLILTIPNPHPWNPPNSANPVSGSQLPRWLLDREVAAEKTDDSYVAPPWPRQWRVGDHF